MFLERFSTLHGIARALRDGWDMNDDCLQVLHWRPFMLCKNRWVDRSWQ